MIYLGIMLLVISMAYMVSLTAGILRSEHDWHTLLFLNIIIGLIGAGLVVFS